MTKYKIVTTHQFEKDLKRCKKRGLPTNELLKVLTILANDGKLPAKYKSHKLSGNHDNEWECHIKADWLLIWQQYNEELRLVLIGTGSHSDLF